MNIDCEIYSIERYKYLDMNTDIGMSCDIAKVFAARLKVVLISIYKALLSGRDLHLLSERRKHFNTVDVP